MVNFNTIKPAITNACKLVNNNSSNIDDRYQFVLDLNALEAGINKLDPTLHVIGFVGGSETTKIYSKTIDNKDITNVAIEYFHKKKEIEMISEDNFNYVEFMIYCTDIEDETLKQFVDDIIKDPETGKSKAIIESIDSTPSSFVSIIMANFPVYKILVTRKFNYKKDKFTYNSVFRSNYAMIDYIENKFKKNN